MAPQELEKIESAPGIGMVSEASNPQHLVDRAAADRARPRLTSRKNDKSQNCRKRLVPLEAQRRPITGVIYPFTENATFSF